MFLFVCLLSTKVGKERSICGWGGGPLDERRSSIICRLEEPRKKMH